jgi:hypothetical protein
MFRIAGVFGVIVGIAVSGFGQEPTAPSPADGHAIHVTAPHVVAGKVMGP